MRSWRQSAQVYGDRRVLALLFLGFSSGLPFGVLAEPLTAWLTESGASKTAIGLFALVSLPYSLKFLWAPLMDNVALPILTRMFGRRRGWVLLTQVLLLAVIWGMGLTNPAENLWWTALFAVSVAFASASQDIVIDAYRVEILETHKLAAGAATATFGWRVGQVGAGAAGLIFADLLPWAIVYGAMAALVVVGIIAILVNPEPKTAAPEEAKELTAHSRLYVAVVCPFQEFLMRPGWLAVIGFILLYKFGDAVLSVMKIPFFLEIGFSKTQIAEIAKLFGFNAIIAGGLLGGILLARLGIMRGLMVCGVLMALSNLIFVVQAWAGNDLWMLALTIAVENITTGMGTTAFVAYLSSLCNVAYTATQYALLTSLMAFSRTVMSSGAGWLADQVEWQTFFILTTLAALPGLVLLAWMMRRFHPLGETGTETTRSEADA
jgi:PAT family beta-lactamase induction signal transducer AmpG